MTMEIVGNDAQFNEKVTLLKDLEIYGNIKNKTKDTSFDFSDNLSFKIQGKEKLNIGNGYVSVFQDLDVNGHTNLDNVSIAGVTTFGNNINASGISRFEIASIENALLDGSIEHTGDIDTKISFDTDTIKFDTAGSERLRIKSDGETNIGTGATTIAKFCLTGASNGGHQIVGQASDDIAALEVYSQHGNDINKLSFAVSDNRTGSKSNAFVVRGNGTVGINSSIPAATLDIHDIGSTGPNLLLRGGSQTEGDIVVPDGEALQIGHWNYGSNTFSERYRMKSNGHLFINTTVNPLTNAEALINMRVDDGEDGVNIRHDMSGHCINIWRSNGNGSALEFYRNDGSQGSSVGRINLTTTGVDYATGSDYRLKENAVGITSAITRLKTLKPYRFNFINDPTKTVDGFFAHEVTAVPEAITGTKDEVDSDNNPVYQGIDQSKLVPLLTAALQEAVAKIETLEAKVAALESA